MQFSLLQSGHLKLLMLSLMKHHPSQSGVLQWNEFLEVAWTSFNDFCWCFSKTAGDTSYKKDKVLSPNEILHDKMSVVTFFIHTSMLNGVLQQNWKKMNAKFKYSTNLVSCKLNAVWMNRNGILWGFNNFIFKQTCFFNLSFDWFLWRKN